MAIKFKLIQKRDMKGGKKFYPQVITNGNVTFTKLCQEIADQSSLTDGDVKNCLDRLTYVMASHLADGQMAVDARQMAHGADATAVRAQGTERGIASCTKGRDDAHARDINRWGHAVGKGKRGKKVERQGDIISCDGP